MRKAVPAVFTLELGKPAGELRTLGTGGLLAPDANPGSYLFLTCADPATRRGVVAGWITHERGSGVVFSGVKDGKVEFKAQLDYGHLQLPAGATAKLETLAIGVFDDARLGEEQYGDALARQHRIKLRPQVAGYCTWYSIGAGNEKSIVELAEFAARELKPFGFSFVQIDDGWQDGRSFNGPLRGFDRVKPDGPYPHGMQPVAEKIKQLGLTPGIWFLPFARNYQDPEYQDRQHWFVKRTGGQPYDNYWGGTSLDLTHPEVRGHLTNLVKTIRSWGYDYFKMDGLWTGMAAEQIAYVNDGYRDDGIGQQRPLPRSSENQHRGLPRRVEAVARGGRAGRVLLRLQRGPEHADPGRRRSAWWIRCASAPTTKPGWGGVASGPLRGSRLYFLNGRIWWNDPDPYYVRGSLESRPVLGLLGGRQRAVQPEQRLDSRAARRAAGDHQTHPAGARRHRPAGGLLRRQPALRVAGHRHAATGAPRRARPVQLGERRENRATARPRGPASPRPNAIMPSISGRTSRCRRWATSSSSRFPPSPAA